MFSLNFIRQTPKSSLQFESNTEHDGDIEDISDGERTSSDHGITFYPNVPGTPTYASYDFHYVIFF